VSAFAGFPPDAWTFLTDLEADNTKAFFDANRRRYDDDIASPSKALVPGRHLTPGSWRPPRSPSVALRRWHRSRRSWPGSPPSMTDDAPIQS